MRRRASGEQDRAITADVCSGLVDAGLFDLMLPRSLGGQEADLLTMVRAVKEVARADGSAGWCAMISGVYEAFGGLLPRAGAEKIFAQRPTIIAGALAPVGQAVLVPGGYRVSGRWTFGSNSAHANWFVGGCIVMDGEQPVMRFPTLPRMVLAFMPRDEVQIIDTWHTTGLAGTASHDYSVADVFVPAERTFWFSDPPVEKGTLFRLPIVAAFGTVIAAVSIGIAWHALDIFVGLSSTKKPIMSELTLREKASIQERVGLAYATIDAADAYLERVTTDAWAVTSEGRRLDWRERGRLWLGSTHAAQQSLQAIESLYTATGGGAVYASTGLDRCLRDARTAVQHIMTQVLNYEVAGKELMGLPVFDSIWAIDSNDGDFPAGPAA